MMNSATQVTVSSAALRLGMVTTSAVAAISPVHHDHAVDKRRNKPVETGIPASTTVDFNEIRPVNAMDWYNRVARLAVQQIEIGGDYKGLNEWA